MKLLLVGCTFFAVVVRDVVHGDCHHHNAVFKSVLATDHECGIYLGDRTCDGGDCRKRCRGLLTRYWNDSLGVPSATINRFYRPSIHDLEYHERTECCLSDVRKKVPLMEVCRRADASISCYNQHYGNLEADIPAFIPFTDLQHQQILQECLDILRIPDSILVGYAKHGIAKYAEAKCALRCFLLREGLYTDAAGPDLHRMSAQCEENYAGEEFRQQASRYIRKLQGQCINKCELVYRIADECVNGDVELLQIFAGVSTSLSTNLTSSPTTAVIFPPKITVDIPSVFPRPFIG